MFTKILVPVDLADPEHYTSAVKSAGDMARQYGAELRLVTVVAPVQPTVAHYLPADTHQKFIDEARTTLIELAGDSGLAEKASGTVREGNIYHEVLDEAEAFGADLIVMGSHRPGMSTYLLGSNAARIVRHASCSVLVLR